MSEKNETVIEDSNPIITTDSADLQAENEKLRAKNKELLIEKQKVKQKAQEAQDAADNAATQAAERNGDIEALKVAHANELKKLQDKLDASSNDLRTIRVDNEITRALAEGNVFDYQIKPLTFMFKAEVSYENGIATIEGKPIADHISEYLGSTEGQHMRRGSTTSGSSATGNTTPTVAPMLTKRPVTQAEWDYLDNLEVNARNALCDRISAPDLKL